MKPIENHDQALQAVQVGLTVLSDEKGSTPNNLLEGVVSFKSILRGLLQGQLVLCSAEQKKPSPPPEQPRKPLDELIEEAEAEEDGVEAA